MNAALSIALWLAAQTGTITGTVRYTGDDVPAPVGEIDVDVRTCGKSSPILPEDLIVRAGALANAAVIVAMPPEASPPLTAARLDQKNCTFLPHVQTVTLGSELVIGNSDPIIHNVHAMVGKETMFNLGMPLQGVSVKRKLDSPGIHEMSCDSGHWWMKAFAVVVPHRFHATTGTEGKFRIEAVPAGKQRISIWHERLGTREMEIEVKPDEETAVDVSMDGAATPVAETAPIPSPPHRLEEERSKPRQDEIRRDQVRREGRALYLAQCATCHGERGDGRGISAKFLSSAPRDFTVGEFKFRTTPSGRAATIDDLYRTVMLGIPGTEMPAFRRRLSQEQVKLLAEYVTTFSSRYVESHQIEPIPIPEPPPATPGAIERGRALYVKLKCAQCHGSGGDGSDAEQRRLHDDRGRATEATDLTRSFYKGGRGLRVIYRALTTGLSGSPMPAFAHFLDETERWDLARYVESLGDSGLGDWLLDRDVGRRTVP